MARYTHEALCTHHAHKDFQSNPSTPKACNSKAQAAAWKNDPTGELRPVGPCGIRAIAFAPQGCAAGLSSCAPFGAHPAPCSRAGGMGPTGDEQARPFAGLLAASDSAPVSPGTGAP